MTGAGQGIGAEYARAGAAVTVADLNEANGKAVEDELRAAGHRAPAKAEPVALAPAEIRIADGARIPVPGSAIKPRSPAASPRASTWLSSSPRCRQTPSC